MSNRKPKHTKLTKTWYRKKNGRWSKDRQTVSIDPRVGVTDTALPGEKSHSVTLRKGRKIYRSLSADGSSMLIAVEEPIMKGK